jgi:hypothetical protein
MSCAAFGGHLQLCQWLRAQQCPRDDSVTHAAAIGHHCELLRWLIESGCPYDAHALCTSAAETPDSNDFSILQHLYEQGILTESQVLTDTLNAAGSLGNLAVLKWLKQHGAEWPAVLSYTRLSGDLHGMAKCLHGLELRAVHHLQNRRAQQILQ